MTEQKNDRAVMIFTAILAGLVFAVVWRVDTGLFVTLIVLLAWNLYRQSRRLEDLEQEVRHLSSTLATLGRGNAAPSAQPAAGPREEPLEISSVSAQPQQDETLIEDKALDLDLDVAFDQLDVPAAPADAPARGSEGFVSLALNWIKGYFSGGNLMVRVGVIVLFFGVAFLLKYAADHSMLPIELRLAGTALGGLAILVVGWRLRHQREAYALTLQGGAVGVLYLTVFAGLRLYGVIPHGLAFGLLLVFVALSALLALLQNSRALIVLASAGGFLAPVLTSTGEGSHVALFSYYLLLNAGILTVAWFKAWRVLNLVGFAFTFVVGALWGWRYYQPTYFATTEPFLIAFFLLYVGIAVLFALRQPPNLKGLVDGSLVFGVPLVAAGLQAALVRDFEYGLAFSALGLGAFYILLTAWLFRRAGQALRMLSESFLATGVVFTTLAIPFAFEGKTTSAFWALEGAALVWVGLRQSRLLPRLFGAALQILAGLFYLLDAYRPGETVPVLNALFLGTLLIALAGWFSSYSLERNRERISVHEQQWLPGLFFVWGFLWWLGGCVREIDEFSPYPHQWAWLLGALALTAASSEVLRLRLDWSRLRYASLGLLPLLLPVAMGMHLDVSRPFVEWTGLAWLAVFAVHYWLLRHYDEWRPKLLRFWHAGSFWLLLFLLASEAAWQADRLIEGARIWRMIPWALVPLLMLPVLLRFGGLLSWPVKRFHEVYTGFTPAPVILYLLVWGMLANATQGADPRPLDYLPIINPLDLVVLFTLLVTVHWWRYARDWLGEMGIGRSQLLAVLGVVLFLWLNGMVIRTVHHWGDVPLQTRAMFDSQVFQASISVLWALVGLGGMLLGNWFKNRMLWMLAAGLMGLVVAKLFLVDLSSTGTVARIVSFIGVGLLLLVVGYFSPVPPREAQRERAE